MASRPNALQALRHERRLAIWGLATRAGTSPATISAVEHWGYFPGPQLDGRLCHLLRGRDPYTPIFHFHANIIRRTRKSNLG